MPLDGFAAAALARHLEDHWSGARVVRITDPETFHIVLHLRVWDTRGELHLAFDDPARPAIWLAAPANEPRHEPGVHPTGSSHPSAFCMLLRKHLESTRLLQVVQPGWDRVLHLVFESTVDLGSGRRRTLVLELIPRRANAVLLDAEARHIVDALHRRPGRVDERAPGRRYVPPPPRERLAPDAAENEIALLLRLAPPDRSLAHHVADHVDGLSRQGARIVLDRAGLDPRRQGPPDEAHIQRLVSTLRTLAHGCRTGHVEPAVRFDGRAGEAEGQAYPEDPSSPLAQDVWPFPPTDQGGPEVWITYPTMLDAVRVWAESTRAEERRRTLHERLERAVRAAVKRAERKLARRRDDLARAKETADYKRAADLLMANLHAINPDEAGLTSVEVVDWYREPDETGEPERVQIPLDPTMSVMANAQRYYRRHSKYKQALDIIARQVREAEDELAYLQHVELALQWDPGREELEELHEELVAGGYVQGPKEPGRAPRPPRRSESETSRPYRFILADGTEVRVGRNNKQNDRLTMGWARPDDIWLHARGIPGAHVILRVDPSRADGEPDGDTLTTAAELAAWFSRARGQRQVPVDFTRRRYVRKPRGARPGMVIYERERTLFVTPRLPEPRHEDGGHADGLAPGSS